MLQLTDNAKEYLANQTESQRKRFAYLSVLGGGCSGFQYKWEMTDSKEDGILVDDILVVDKLAEMFVLGCTIDYVKGEVILFPVTIVSSTLSNRVEIEVTPESNDIVAKENLYIVLDTTGNSKLNLLEDVLVSGSNISGTNYTPPSSFISNKKYTR